MATLEDRIRGLTQFGATGFKFGAHAEYACLPENATLALKPVNSLDEIAEAHRYAEAGHKKGHVVILLAQEQAQ